MNGGAVKSDNDVPVRTATKFASSASEAAAADSSQQRSWTNEQEKGIRAAMSSPLVDKVKATLPSYWSIYNTVAFSPTKSDGFSLNT